MPFGLHCINANFFTDYKPPRDFPTPRLASFDYDEMEYRDRYNQEEEEDTGENPDRLEWEEEQKHLDREWYNIEESSGVMLKQIKILFPDYSQLLIFFFFFLGSR